MIIVHIQRPEIEPGASYHHDTKPPHTQKLYPIKWSYSDTLMNQTVFTTHRLDRISGNYGAVSPFTINNLYPHSRLGLVSFTDRRMSFRSFIIFVYFCTKPLFIIYFVLCVYMRSKGRLICQPVFHMCPFWLCSFFCEWTF